MNPIETTPTLQDVALAAGVSTATVSRALNQPDSVRPALRAQVLEAVARLGYVPHAGARAMSLRRSGTVGLVVPTIDNAIFARGVQAFQRSMVAQGRHVLLAISDYDPAQELAQVNNLMARGVDALAFTGISQQAGLTERLAQRGLPWVHCVSYPAPAGHACVGFRNREAIMRAVRYLLQLGHRRFAMLAGLTTSNDRASERLAGVRQALQEAGLSLPAAAVVESAYELQSAREGTRRLLAQAGSATALLCGNDVLAYGALLEAQAQGLAVPEQLSVVGFDDLDLSRHWQPALTTLHVPIERMWTLAAQYLVQRLDGDTDQALQQELEVELVVRDSTAPPFRAARSSRPAPSERPERTARPARTAKKPPPAPS